MKVAITFLLLFAFYDTALVAAQFQITGSSRGLKKGRGQDGGNVAKKTKGEKGPTFSIITLTPDAEDPTHVVTMVTPDVPSEPVLAKGPCALLGLAPLKMIEELCKKVKHGDSSFHVNLIMPGYHTGYVPVTLSLADAYGCDLPNAPSGVKAKFSFGGEADYLVWCSHDAQQKGFCSIWMYAKFVTDSYHSQTSRNLVVVNPVNPLVRRHLNSTQSYKICNTNLEAATTKCANATGTCQNNTDVITHFFCTSGIDFGFCMFIPRFIWFDCAFRASLEQTAECFPGDAEVLKLDAGKVLISEIKVGDQVATAITKNGDLLFESVYFLGHDEADAYSLFFHIEMEPVDKKSGNASYAESVAVEMTPFHFVPVNRVSSHWVNTRAVDVSIGDVILASSQDRHQRQALLPHIVTQKTIVMKFGLFNPYTMSGRILVNNVSVSSHSEWILDPFFDALGLTSWLPSVYQFILSPLRAMMYVLGPTIYKKTSIATLLAKAINGGSNEEIGVFPAWTITNVYVHFLSLLVVVWLLTQRTGKRTLGWLSAQLW